MESTSEPLLEVRRLSVDFHTADGTVHAINDLSYTLRRGETLGIVGESGSGKSVSSLGVMGLIACPPGEIVSGSIMFEGRDIIKMKEKDLEKIRGDKISMIFQEPMTSLNPIITCGDQIAESLMFHRGMKKKEALVEAERLMKEVGIANADRRMKEYPHQMSGGMKQRVMIAIALACEPQILICDEPTTALDVTIQAQILDLINKLKEEHGTSVIMITHDFGVISEVADRVIVMYCGKVVEEAPIGDIFKHPLHPYTKGLIESIPKARKSRGVLPTIEGTVPNPTENIEGCSFWPRCKYATDKCKTNVPHITHVSEGRSARCFLVENEFGSDK